MARKASSPVFVSLKRYRSIEGVVAVQRKIAAIPPGAVAEVKSNLEKGGDILVSRIKANAPVNEKAARPGALRDSVRREAGDHELAILVLEDAVDEGGHIYPKHVEHGHRAEDGTHVPPLVHFWNAYRATKRIIRSLVGKAMVRGAEKAFRAPQGDA